MIEVTATARTAAIVFFLAIVTPAFIAAQTCGGPIEVKVQCVLGTDTNLGLDERLRPIGSRLQRLFRYSTYRLVSYHKGHAICGQGTAFDLPGGRVLHVEPQDVRDDTIRMQVVLFQGEKPLMTTDVKLLNHGLLFLGGSRYEQGMLIIAIEAGLPDTGSPGSKNSPVLIKPTSASPSPSTKTE